MLKILTAGLLCLGSLISYPLLADDLPDLGDASEHTITKDQAQRIGSGFIGQLYQSGLIIEDTLLSDYVQQLGQRLLAAGGVNGQYRFFLIDEPSINAFALPGGYIVVHSGLFLNSGSEDELASVLAHEIAHVSQHHIARRFEKLEKNNLPLTAILLGALLLGADNPQVGQAALAASVAGQAESELAYSREFEREADRLGIELLAGAGFDPHSMASFFDKLQRHSHGGAIPEFLSTHPVTASRIVEAEHRAHNHAKQAPSQGIDFRLARARLAALSRHGRFDRLEHFAQLAEQGDNADRYTYALLLQQGGRHDEARKLMLDLFTAAPQRIAYLDGLAQSELALGQDKVALARYRQGLSDYPGNTLLTLGYSKTLLQSGQAEEARRQISRLLRSRPELLPAYELLAQSESALNNPGGSHLARAAYQYHRYSRKVALQLLHNALQDNKLDFYHRERIEARIRVWQFEQSAEEAR